MPRESRKRGKEINTRGISKEFACVLCGVDRLGNIYTGLICDGRPKYTDIDRALSEVIQDNSILCLILSICGFNFINYFILQSDLNKFANQ